MEILPGGLELNTMLTILELFMENTVHLTTVLQMTLTYIQQKMIFKTVNVHIIEQILSVEPAKAT